MVREAVNDHLRVVSAQNPLDVRSGGIHQVKPWFEGRLDFAPVVRFAGDDEFPLQGGAVGYFLDRKAAVLVFNRRLHRITLLVFRAEGLPWPSSRSTPMGDARAHDGHRRAASTPCSGGRASSGMPSCPTSTPASSPSSARSSPAAPRDPARRRDG